MFKTKITIEDNPYTLFQKWFVLAQKKEPNNPDAICLSTVDERGRPSSRMVLLKEIIVNKGFVFYTNFNSRKGKQLLANPYAAICIYWKSMQRQIRIEGKVVEVAPEQADAYFHSRPKDSQIGAWASLQSEVLPHASEFKKRILTYTKKYALSREIPRPPHWSGFCLQPDYFEFWQEGMFRLHDRLIYQQDDQQNWQTFRLYP